MLAYVFWHCPRAGVNEAAYEARLRAFHRALGFRSASFRLSGLPFAERGGYEDWYLVDGWTQLGELNRAAISGPRQAPHDAVAEAARDGWGAVYALARGDALPPVATRWMDKPREQTYDAFLGNLRGATVWQRQMVLGPAPEFCVVENGRDGTAGNERVAIYVEGR
jgi:hypothetical protein